MMFALLGAALATAHYPCLGLALNVPTGGGTDAMIAAMRQGIRLGLDGGTVSVKWDEIASQGTKPMTDGIGGADFVGQKILLTIATVDTVRRKLPPDLMSTAWDSPEMEGRFDSFLGQIAPLAKGHISWLSLGNEVNPYLSVHPEEEGPYLKFLAHSRDTVHRLMPGVLVGVTVTCVDALGQPQLAERLQDGMDATIFTYYPLTGFKVITPLDTEGHFSFMTRIAGSRPLLLQEIGCPASEAAGSSEDVQAQFVDQVFAQLDKHAEAIPLAVFFIKCDLPKEMVQAMTGYYEVDQPAFRAFLGSLGLQDETGKPRKAWPVFVSDCLRRKPIE